jgi:type IV secretory pathway VirB6-like protein
MTKISNVYRWCMERLNDGEYCANVVDAVIQATRSRLFQRASRRGTVLQLLLLYDGGYEYDVLLDKDKRRVAVLLNAPTHTVALLYETDKGVVLKDIAISKLEFVAMMNGPFSF